jgi:hypothetical protein
MRDPLAPLARLLRCTPGQLWTIVVLLALGLALLFAVLPAVHHPPLDVPRPTTPFDGLVTG